MLLLLPLSQPHLVILIHCWVVGYLGEERGIQDLHGGVWISLSSLDSSCVVLRPLRHPALLRALRFCVPCVTLRSPAHHTTNHEEHVAMESIEQLKDQGLCIYLILSSLPTYPTPIQVSLPSLFLSLTPHSISSTASCHHNPKNKDQLFKFL